MAPTTILLDLPASVRYLSVLSACLAETLAHIDVLSGVPDRQTFIYNIQLATHEICANVIEHAYRGDRGGRLTIQLTWDVSEFAADIHDTGAAFDLAAVSSRQPEAMQERGYGLFLVRNLMDEVTYQSDRSGNHWRLIKRLRN